MIRQLCLFGLLILSTAFLIGCGQSNGKRVIKIGMVAKSQSNDVFQAAYSGAKDAAKELGEKYNADIEIVWKTPPEENAEKQVEAIEELTRAQVDAIIVSCTNGQTLKKAIDAADAKGIPVMCFDSDSPDSKRFAFYGTDDAPCGQVIMAQLAKSMHEEGTVAILGGQTGSTNLGRRIAGAKEELKKYPKMKLVEVGQEPNKGVFFHKETPEAAAQAIQDAERNSPEIQGWCLVGGWPLFTKDALHGFKEKGIKVASCDALPPQLEYLRSDEVQTLFAQDCYGWGHKSVEVVLEKIVNKKDPPSVRIIDPLQKVTKAGGDDSKAVDEFAKNWEKWLKK